MFILCIAKLGIDLTVQSAACLQRAVGIHVQHAHSMSRH